MSFAYLASPYHHEDAVVVLQRYEAVKAATVKFWARGITVFSPIVHCHEMKPELPKEFEFWIEHDYQMLEMAHSLYILTLDGWEISRGVRAETAFSVAAKKPIVLFDEYLNESAYVGLA